MFLSPVDLRRSAGASGVFAQRSNLPEPRGGFPRDASSTARVAHVPAFCARNRVRCETQSRARARVAGATPQGAPTFDEGETSPCSLSDPARAPTTGADEISLKSAQPAPVLPRPVGRQTGRPTRRKHDEGPDTFASTALARGRLPPDRAPDRTGAARAVELGVGKKPSPERAQQSCEGVRKWARLRNGAARGRTD